MEVVVRIGSQGRFCCFMAAGRPQTLPPALSPGGHKAKHKGRARVYRSWPPGNPSKTNSSLVSRIAHLGGRCTVISHSNLRPWRGKEKLTFTELWKPNNYCSYIYTCSMYALVSQFTLSATLDMPHFTIFH